MMQSGILILAALSLWTQLVASHVIDLSHYGIQADKRADKSLVGYLGAFFLGADPYVYFYLSNGNNAVSFKSLNGGKPVLSPKLGTKGVRDPYVVQGGGAEAGKKWYIIGTDLNIATVSIFVWESVDLVNWTSERLAIVEDKSAGMVWAPEAIWDAAKGQYLVHWASKFYPASDPKHTGSPSLSFIRYAYTSDFKTFSAPQTYIDKSPVNIIDLDIVPLDAVSKNYVRFMKDENVTQVFLESSTSGLFGSWKRAGGSTGYISGQVEGPAGFRDNLVDNKVHVLLDFYGSDGYRPYESTNSIGNVWNPSTRSGFPTQLRHGSVLPINQTLYDSLNRKWG